MLFKTSRSKISKLTSPVTAAPVPTGKIASRFQQIALDPANHFYLDDWAVSAYEKFGLNENADGFEKEELLRSYPTFTGSWVCLDHNNYHESLAVGRNIDAVYMPEDYVRIVMGVNRQLSERVHPGLEAKIASNVITDTSMGCWARESVCTIPKCANVATDESQFCDHVRNMRGQEICNADSNWVRTVCGELNRGVIFFENSIITDAEGADKNAKIIAKLASNMTGVKSIPADKLYRVMRNLSKTASKEERVVIAHVLEHLIREL